MALILITHDMGIVAGMTDRIIVMYAGYVVEENRTENLFSQPAHPYTLGLLTSIPRVDKQTDKKLFTIKGTPPNLVNLPDVCPFYPRCERMLPVCKEKMPELKMITSEHRLACYNPLWKI